MREHLLLGNPELGTARAACGQAGVDQRDLYVEAEYVRVRAIATLHPCGRCEAAWRKICRARNQPWVPIAKNEEREYVKTLQRKPKVCPVGRAELRKPRRVFVNSMSDLFHERLTNEQIAAVFGVMAAAPHHTFQILTKPAIAEQIAATADAMLLDHLNTPRVVSNAGPIRRARRNLDAAARMLALADPDGSSVEFINELVCARALELGRLLIGKVKP